VLFKTRQGVERHVEIIRALVPERIVELGIFRGSGLIAGVELSWDAILVRRGAAPVDPGSFAVAEWFEQML
jgi:hypothetical protein